MLLKTVSVKDCVLWVFQGVFESLMLTRLGFGRRYDLNVDTLDMHASKESCRKVYTVAQV